MPAATDPAAILALDPDDHVLAVGDPKVTVVEYADYQCPGCRWFALTAFPTIRQNYINTGKVRWIFRHSPLSIHPDAQAAAEASECADDQGKFWEYHEFLFSSSSGLANEDLKAYASQLGLDSTTFDACLDSGAKAAHVQSEQADSYALNVPGTFAFFINGNMIAGLRFNGEFVHLLDAAIADAGG